MSAYLSVSLSFSHRVFLDRQPLCWQGEVFRREEMGQDWLCLSDRSFIWSFTLRLNSFLPRSFFSLYRFFPPMMSAFSRRLSSSHTHLFLSLLPARRDSCGGVCESCRHFAGESGRGRLHQHLRPSSVPPSLASLSPPGRTLATHSAALRETPGTFQWGPLGLRAVLQRWGTGVWKDVTCLEV